MKSKTLIAAEGECLVAGSIISADELLRKATQPIRKWKKKQNKEKT